MTNTINKNFLENVRMSDLSDAWILEARGFYHSSKALLRGNTITKGKKFISTKEAHIVRSCYKIACYLLAHIIELTLKAIYCLHIGDDVEKYSHGILKLLNDLMDKNVIKKCDVDNETFELASILLAWHGRYHRPNKKKIKETIKKLWIPFPDNPDMLRRKFDINNESYGKLDVTAKILMQMVPIPAESIMLIVFDPF